jgi:hypothetical protein
VADLRWKLPLRHDGMGMYIFDADGCMVAQIRGWGSLTDHPHRLSDDAAVEVQKARAEAFVAAINGAQG